MKRHRILFERRGENSTTAPDPVRPWDWSVDLSETRSYCLSFDDDRLVTCERWQLRDITLPDWLSPEEWCRDNVFWQQLWDMGVPEDWPEVWQRGLQGFTPAQVLASVKLLRTEKFRSEFRRDLRQQLVLWFDQVPPRAHRSPFSPRQWDALIDRWTARDARRLSENGYHARRYRAPGREVPPEEARR